MLSWETEWLALGCNLGRIPLMDRSSLHSSSRDKKAFVVPDMNLNAPLSKPPLLTQATEIAEKKWPMRKKNANTKTEGHQ